MKKTLKEKIFDRISVQDSGCWMWTGHFDPQGKARFRTKTIIRVLYGSLTKSDLLIKMGCSNASCVNPAHYTKMTRKEFAQLTEIPIKKRLKDNVLVRPNGCWEWQLALEYGGYGIVNYRGVSYRAHRLAFEVFKRPIKMPVIMHICDNPKCINPDHLVEGTQLENVQDSFNKGRR